MRAALCVQEGSDALLSRCTLLSRGREGETEEEDGECVWTTEEVAAMLQSDHLARPPLSEVELLLAWMQRDHHAVRLQPPPALSPNSASLPAATPSFFAVGAPPSVHALSYERATVRWMLRRCAWQAEGKQTQAVRSVTQLRAGGAPLVYSIAPAAPPPSRPPLPSPLRPCAALSDFAKWPAVRCERDSACRRRLPCSAVTVASKQHTKHSAHTQHALSEARNRAALT